MPLKCSGFPAAAYKIIRPRPPPVGVAAAISAIVRNPPPVASMALGAVADGYNKISVFV